MQTHFIEKDIGRYLISQIHLKVGGGQLTVHLNEPDLVQLDIENTFKREKYFEKSDIANAFYREGYWKISDIATTFKSWWWPTNWSLK